MSFKISDRQGKSYLQKFQNKLNSFPWAFPVCSSYRSYGTWNDLRNQKTWKKVLEALTNYILFINLATQTWALMHRGGLKKKPKTVDSIQNIIHFYLLGQSEPKKVHMENGVT